MKALRSLERIECVAHVLQTCLRHTFKGTDKFVARNLRRQGFDNISASTNNININRSTASVHLNEIL